MPPDSVISSLPDQSEPMPPACVLVFNSNDPCGASGLAADVVAIACAGAHALPIMTGAFARDTAQIFDHFTLDDEAVAEQARAVLEDVEVQAIKLGFAGTPDNLGVIAGLAADYADVPLIACMPDLSWWNNDAIEAYHDAFSQLVLPQTAVLVGSHSTLWRWLLPHWHSDRPPGARDIAMAAGALGARCTLVTGINLAERGIKNALATPQSVLASVRFGHLDGPFVGSGDTLSASFCALLANGNELVDTFVEALNYLDGSLKDGFRPGMGHTLPQRLFWAKSPRNPDDAAPDASLSTPTAQHPPPHDKPH